MSTYTIKLDTRRKLLLFFARDSAAEELGKTGLRHDTPGASAAYARDNGDVATIPLVAGEVGRSASGSLVEVNAESLPGIYQLGAPDEMLAAGATTVVLTLRFPGAVVDPIEIHLVAFDPQDPVRLGMSALGPKARIEALQGAFPLLAAKEIEERQATMEPNWPSTDPES